MRSRRSMTSGKMDLVDGGGAGTKKCVQERVRRRWSSCWCWSRQQEQDWARAPADKVAAMIIMNAPSPSRIGLWRQIPAVLWVCGVLKLLSTRHLWNEDQNNLKICGIADRLTDGQKNKYMPNLVKIQCSENIFYDDDHLPRLQVSLVPCDNTDNRDDEWQLQGQTPGQGWKIFEMGSELFIRIFLAPKI